nr:hypothetical protein [Kofleriaceae bacterium]
MKVVLGVIVAWFILSVGRDARAQAPTKRAFVATEFTSAHCWNTATASGTPSVVVTRQSPPPLDISSSPSPDVTITDVWNGMTIGERDPQVAAGGDFLVAIDAGSYRFFQAKNAGYTALSTSGCLPLSGAASALFAPLLLETDHDGVTNPNNLNQRAASGVGANPLTFVEDVRARYHDGHFWIAGAASNGVEAPATNASRVLVVAISKTADPRDGFLEYALFQQYEDWPTISIETPWLIVGHKNDTDLWLYDASKLAAGTATDPYKDHFDLAGQHGISMVTPIWMPSGTGPTLVYGRVVRTTKGVLVGIDGQGNRSLTDVQLPIEARWSMEPVYRHGSLWFARDYYETVANEIDVLQVPVSFTGAAPAAGAPQLYKLVRTDEKLGFPGIEVTSNGGVVVFYLAFSSTKPCEMRYQAMLPGETHFRDHVTWHTGPEAIASETDISDLDLPGAQETDDNYVWLSTMDDTVPVTGSSHPHAIDQAIAKVDLACGGTLCDGRCVDGAVDVANCGGCNAWCGGSDHCENLRCCYPCACRKNECMPSKQACDDWCNGHSK